MERIASDPERCRDVAQIIRQVLAATPDGETIADLPGDEMEEAEEGRVATAMHLRYERNSALVQAKKRRALAMLGKLACESCGFNFRERYGERGDGYIECHHTRPVHALKPGDKTKFEDLRLLCSNCHRMVHAKRPWLTIDQLTAVLRG
jgi:5-methylcytosine-specific restriction protein A